MQEISQDGYSCPTSCQLVEAPTGTPTDPRQAGSSSKLQRVRLQILDKLAARRSSNGYAYRSSTSCQLVEAPTGTPTDPRQAGSLSDHKSPHSAEFLSAGRQDWPIRPPE